MIIIIDSFFMFGFQKLTNASLNLVKMVTVQTLSITILVNVTLATLEEIVRQVRQKTSLV